MRRARTPSTRKKIRVIPKRRSRSQTPIRPSTRKRLGKQSKKSMAAPVGKPGKAPSKKGKRMPLDENHKAILLEKTQRQDLRKDFDRTDRYTIGTKGHEFTFLQGIDMDKLRRYIQNDEALNDQQFWQDYNQEKLSIPPKRTRALKVSDLKNPTSKEKKNLYTYVLGCIQEKMHEGYFDKYTSPGEPDPEWGVSSEDDSVNNDSPRNQQRVFSPTHKNDLWIEDYEKQWE